MRARSAQVIASITAAVVALAVVIALHPSQRTSGTPSALHPVATVAPQPPASPVAVTKAPKDTRPHDHVAGAAPTHFVISGPAFTVSANVCGMDPVFPLDPPGDQLHTVCWVDHGFGVAPSSASKGTTYVLGHSWALEKLVLNPVSEFATAHEGRVAYSSTHIATYSVPALTKYTMTLTTANGTLGYVVTRAFLVGKLDAGRIASVMATTTPNRLVLITCAVADGIDLPQNVILYATLAWSKSAKH